jgi:hypothetical protein
MPAIFWTTFCDTVILPSELARRVLVDSVVGTGLEDTGLVPESPRMGVGWVTGGLFRQGQVGRGGAR